LDKNIHSTNDEQQGDQQRFDSTADSEIDARASSLHEDAGVDVSGSPYSHDDDVINNDITSLLHSMDVVIGQLDDATRGADGAGWTALRAAAWVGRLDHLESLLDAGHQPDEASADGLTALRAASWAGNVDSVALLLRRGANPAVTDGEIAYQRFVMMVKCAFLAEGRTALIAAAYMGRTEVIQMLVDTGADIDHKVNFIYQLGCVLNNERGF